MIKKIVLTISLSLIYINLYSQFTLSSLVPIDLAGFMYDIYTVDLDGDGLLDIITGEGNPNRIAWYKNNGDETFASQKIIATTPVGNPVYTFAVDDLDGDGDLDIVAGLYSQIIWIENLGNTVFGPTQIISTSVTYVKDVDIGDLDSDGDLDIVSASSNDDKIAFYENLGSGSFGTQVVVTSNFSGANRIVLADINNDGDKDILAGSIASIGTSQLAWFENNGSAGFSAGINLIFGLSAVRDIQVFDSDSDSDLDIVLNYGTINNYLTFLENQGTGIFNSAVSTSISAWGEISTADFDGDSDLDILLSGNGNEINWYENDGTNSFIQNTHNSTGLYGHLVCTGDINSDGNIDIIGSTGLTTIFWSENTGQGQFELGKLVTSTSERENEMAVYDVDQDGKEDVVYCSMRGNNVSWYRNLGGNNYDYISHITDSIKEPRNLIFGRIDNDGLEDLVVATNGQVVWYKNLGNGNFGEVNIIIDSDSLYTEVNLDDFDGDGDFDLLLLSVTGGLALSNNVSTIENLGSGTFGNEVFLPGSFNNISAVTSGDLNNDGHSNIAVTGGLDSSSYNINGIWWWVNDGTGLFNNITKIPVTMFYPNDLKLADLDGDNDLDITATSKGGNSLVFWIENLGSGNFSSQNTISTNTQHPTSIAVTDIDGDNDIDIIVRVNDGLPLVWFENFGGVFSSEITVPYTSNFPSNYNYSNVINFYNKNILAADMNLDGDPEVLIMDQYGRIFTCDNEATNRIEISGKLYVDLNLNNTFDSTDFGINYAVVGSTPQSDYTFSFGNGDYIMDFSDTNGIYIIEPDSLPYWNLVSDSIFYTVAVDTNANLFNNLDFAFYPDTVVTAIDIDLTGQQATCNTTVNYWMNIQNIGTTIPSGVICLELDPSISYTSCLVSPDSIVGQKIYWDYDSLSYFQTNNFYCEVTLPDFTQMGDTMVNVLSVTANTITSSLSTTSDTLFQIITCAYDPNDKVGFPFGVDSLGYILHSTESIEYTIRFQNTGTDTAQNVLISDDLDPNLDWSSLNLISSSHTVQTSIDLLGTVDFTFTNIQLPDSIVNEPASNGYVKFKINLLNSLPVGTSIYNTARIFFDQNPPIITNTEIHTTYNCESIIESIQVPELFCNYNNVNFNASYDSNPSTASYYWNLNSLDTSSSSNFITNPDTTGTFSLYASVNTNFCSADTTLNIQIGITDSLFIDTLTICPGDSTLIFNNYESYGGYYHNTLSSSQFSCDSVLTYFLNVIPEQLTVDSLSICEGDSALVFGNYETFDSIYYDTLTTILGCDSIQIFHLKLNLLPIVSPDTANICPEDSISVFGIYETEAGIYYDSLTTIFGCDSVLTFHLNVYPEPIIYPITLPICEGDSIYVFHTFRKETGVYYDSLNTILGCDSILVFNLNVIPYPIEVKDSIGLCQGDSIMVFGEYIKDSGNYFDTLYTNYGCDSAVSAYIFIYDSSNVYFNVQFDDTLCLENINYPLSASIVGGQFTGSGVVNNNFNPETAGLGAHVIYCTYTDSNGCYNVDSMNILVQNCLGTEDIEQNNKINIFPNPTSGSINVANSMNSKYNVTVINTMGQTVYSKRNISSKNFTFEFEGASGVYILELGFQNIVYRNRIVKQ